MLCIHLFSLLQQVLIFVFWCFPLSSLQFLLFGLLFVFLSFYHILGNVVLLFLHITNVYNRIFQLLFQLLNVGFSMLFFGLLLLLVKVLLLIQHLVFPLNQEIDVHMKIGFLHNVFDLLHKVYQMLMKTFQSLKVLL